MLPHRTEIMKVEKVDTIVHERSSNGQKEAPFTGQQLGVGDLSMEIENIREGVPFTDPDFPADQSSFGLQEPVQWLRSKELGIRDKIWTGQSRGQVRAGGPHNYWLAEALAIVSMQPRLLDKVFVEEHVSRGYVVLRLWRFGKWETVTVDDRIPVPCSITTSCPEEIWPAVIEKAFAKLHGSYAALAGGDTLWGLEDLTGGIAQRLEVPPSALAPAATERTASKRVQTLHSKLFRPLQQALRAGAIVSCRPRMQVQELSERSIHIASVVDSRRKQNGSDVKVRDDTQGSENTRNEGQWMDVKEFVMFYTNIIVTTVRNGTARIQTQDTFGWWEPGISSGGSRNNLEKFAINPQYILTVTQPDESTENTQELGPQSFLIALTQEYRRCSKYAKPPLLPIACFIYKAEVPNERLSAEYFLCVTEEASTGPFINRREVAQQVELEPGHYVLIPATWSPYQHGAFLLRVYALKDFSIDALPQYFPTCAMLPTWVPVTEV